MNADPIAASYRWLEYAAFGRTLERARCDYLAHAAAARNVLILGEGDGRFLCRLLRCNRDAQITVVESSGRMIEQACRRVPASDRRRVQFHQRDAVLELLPAGPFDLAVTHFFLDVLSPSGAQTVVEKINGRLCPTAVWLISEFQVPTSGIRRQHARLWLAAMYRFFAASTGLEASQLPPYRDEMDRFGWAEVEHRERRFGLIRSQVWRKSPRS